MWILTCDGNLFEGRRKWLRPGTTHLFGRTSEKVSEGGTFQRIEHRSVSRKHLFVTISAVPRDGGASLRSQIEFRDASKTSTKLNGEELKQGTRLWDGRECLIKLGNYDQTLKLSWQPIVVSQISPSGSYHIPSDLCSKMQNLGVKIVNHYLSNETTHSLSMKRNTPSALQTLVQGRWLVTKEWLEALAKATDEPGLEEDFDSHRPSEEKFLPQSASEPVPRPDHFLKPNPDRADVFRNFIFILLAKKQYDTLMPVITSGGGKALLLDSEQSYDVQKAVDFVTSVAGRKAGEPFTLTQQPRDGGIVVVRRNDRENNESLMEYMRGIDAALGQRSIEPKQFLDVILTLDTRELKKPLEEEIGEPESSGRPSAGNERAARPGTLSSRQQHDAESDVPNGNSATGEQCRSQADQLERSQSTDQVSKSPAPVAAARKPRRYITQSRFKDFDDFDPSQLYTPAPRASERQRMDQPAGPQESNVNGDVEPPPEKASRKRDAEEEELEEEAMYDAIMPGHAATKRRRMGNAAKKGQKSIAETVSAALRTHEQDKARKKRKEMDVLAEIQARRQKEEEERRKDQESLRNQLEGIDISELKDLAKIEEMEVVRREPPHRRGLEADRSERWDSAWNGRQNFKKFVRDRRRSGVPQLQRVIVTLEEVRKEGHGAGEEYWLEPTTSRNVPRGQVESQTGERAASASLFPNPDEAIDSTRFRSRIRRSRREDQEAARGEELFPEEIAGQARDQSIQAAVEESAQTLTLGAEDGRVARAGSKRPNDGQSRDAAAKRAKQPPAATREPVVTDGRAAGGDLRFRRRRR